MTDLINSQTERYTPDLVLGVWHRRKWLAIPIFVVVAAAAITVTFSLPNLYRASATVLVERQEVSEAFVRPSVTAELETRIQTIRQRAESRDRLQDVIIRLDLYPELRRTEPLEGIVDRMRRDIELRPKVVDQPSGRAATIAFTLSYSGRSPSTVAAVANTLASFYVEENTKSRERQADRTAGFLKEQLVQVKAELDAQERRVNEFAASHTNELPQQLQANLGALERLNTQLRLNGEYQLRAMERLERLEEGQGRAETAPAGPQAATPEAQLWKRKQELAELRRQFSDQYPDVIRVKSEIAALEKQLGGAVGVGPTAEAAERAPANTTKQSARALDDELQSLRQTEGLLRRTIAGYEARVESAPRRQQEIQELSRGYESTKERYQALLKQYQEAQLAATLEQGEGVEQFRILDSAIPPRLPMAPNRLWLAAMGLFASFALALAAVVIAEKLDTTFHTVDDLRAFVDVPTLASIRRIVTSTAVRERRYRVAFVGLWLIAGLTLVLVGSHRLAAGNEQIVRLTARGGM